MINEMKRAREIDTEIRAIIEELSLLHHANQLLINPPVSVPVVSGAGEPEAANTGAHPHRQVSNIPTRPFLSICSLILQVLDKIGPSMTVLRQDVFQNIQRLEKLLYSDSIKYSKVIEILKKEAAEGRTRKRHSCSKALLWLTRSLDMTVALLERIARDSNQSMEHIVEDSYDLTLKPFHGWISSAAFKVAINLLPDKKAFIEVLAVEGESFGTLKKDIQSMISMLVPLLEDLHFILKAYGMDGVKHI